MTTITIDRAVVEQALEALTPWADSDHTVQHAAYHALRAALAEPVPDWSICPACGGMASDPIVPQRKPVEWDGRCMLGHCNSPAGCENSGECRAVEAAHGIKE